MWLELLEKIERIESGYGEKLNSPIDLGTKKLLPYKVGANVNVTISVYFGIATQSVSDHKMDT